MRKEIRIVLKCSPKESKKGKLRGFEIWANLDSEGFGETAEERNTKVLCAKRALEAATSDVARCLNLPVEAFMQSFTEEVIRIYCKPRARK